MPNKSLFISVLLLLNALAVVYVTVDSYLVIELERSQGTMSLWVIWIRLFVIAWPCSTVVVLGFNRRGVLAVFAKVVNLLAVVFGVYGLGYVLMTDVYSPSAIVAVAPFFVLSMLNLYALLTTRGYAKARGL